MLLSLSREVGLSNRKQGLQGSRDVKNVLRRVRKAQRCPFIEYQTIIEALVYILSFNTYIIPRMVFLSSFL